MNKNKREHIHQNITMYIHSHLQKTHITPTGTQNKERNPATNNQVSLMRINITFAIFTATAKLAWQHLIP
jgi:hypothetical protein